jgi:hypothetical protein
VDFDGLMVARRDKRLIGRKYKDNNWFGAMYTYAIAWGCLIPYHPDDMEDSDPKKKEIASLYVYRFVCHPHIPSTSPQHRPQTCCDIIFNVRNWIITIEEIVN